MTFPKKSVVHDRMKKSELSIKEVASNSNVAVLVARRKKGPGLSTTKEMPKPCDILASNGLLDTIKGYFGKEKR